jgi:hypothetical protein
MSSTENQNQKKSSTFERKLGPFITQLRERHHGKGIQLISSRRFRRGLSNLELDAKGQIKKRAERISLLFIIRPRLLSWWIGVLFMIGSLLFTTGAIMNLFFESVLSAFTINLTYFTGSLFFTSAAYGQFLQAINANIALVSGPLEKKRKWRWWARGLRNPGFLSSASQLIGTILFNINTFDAFYSTLTPVGISIMIWVPDMIGSVLFLISSFFAWVEIYHDDFVKRFRTVTWWLVWFNILGSVFFQLSAIYAFINPFTGKIEDNRLSVIYTLLGAVCFFAGAYLSVIEIKEPVKRKKK